MKMTTVLLLLLFKIIDSCVCEKGTCPAFVTCAGASFSALPSWLRAAQSPRVLLRSLQEPPKVPGCPCRHRLALAAWRQLGRHCEKVTLWGRRWLLFSSKEMHCDM